MTIREGKWRAMDGQSALQKIWMRKKSTRTVGATLNFMIIAMDGYYDDGDHDYDRDINNDGDFRRRAAD